MTVWCFVEATSTDELVPVEKNKWFLIRHRCCKFSCSHNKLGLLMVFVKRMSIVCQMLVHCPKDSDADNNIMSINCHRSGDRNCLIRQISEILLRKKCHCAHCIKPRHISSVSAPWHHYQQKWSNCACYFFLNLYRDVCCASQGENR